MRYLEQAFELSFSSLEKRKASYKLVKEASTERENLINNAPHLTRYLPCVIPCTNVFQMLYYYVRSNMANSANRQE